MMHSKLQLTKSNVKTSELIEASSSIQEKAARVFEVRGDFFLQ